MRRAFVDTNILIYSVGDEPSQRPKRDRALDVLKKEPCALSVQVLQEFYVQATRANRADRISREDAQLLIAGWLRFPVQDMTIALMQNALELQARYQFSYWDSAIVAAAIALGCDTLFTEDLSHGQIIEGLRIVDPFRS